MEKDDSTLDGSVVEGLSRNVFSKVGKRGGN